MIKVRVIGYRMETIRPDGTVVAEKPRLAKIEPKTGICTNCNRRVDNPRK